MQVLKYLLVVCVIGVVSIGSTAYARLAKITENLNATVVIVGKKHNEIIKKATVPVGMGTGVFISKDGIILTNHHVIEGSTSIDVYVYDETDSNTYVAEIIGVDKLMDLAVLKIVSDELPSNFNVATFGDSPAHGDDVYMIGHPQSMGWTVTKGVVGHPERYMSTPWQRMIQTDSLIMPGNSGGPLFDEHGNLIGINTSLVPSKDNMNTQAWSMSIHVSDVQWALARILEWGDIRRPALNVSLEYKDKHMFITPNAGGNLERAGLRKKVMLLKLNNAEISNYRDLYKFLKTKKDGDMVMVTIKDENDTEKEYFFNLESWSILEKQETQENQQK